MPSVNSLENPHGKQPNESSPQQSVSNLPRGGGAIRGIDHKLSVDAFSGTLGFELPLLKLPDGRLADLFSPNLSYSSGAGNGAWGVGWSVDLPSIKRRTELGVPAYDDSDTFVLSGADQLVLVADRRQQAWLIATFRPRIENDFALIERWTSAEDQKVCFWRVVSRENRTSIYGLTSEGRLINPDQIDHQYEWRLQFQYDDRGNATVARYFQDTGVFSGTSFGMIYPASIQVGIIGDALPHSNDTSAWLAAIHEVMAGNNFEPCFELQFDYGPAICPEKEQLEPTYYEINPLPRRWIGPDNGWVARQDNFCSFRSGFQQLTQRLCRRVLLFHRFVGEYDDLVRSYELYYDENPYLTKLRAVTQVSYRHPHSDDDMPHDGLVPRAFPPLEFTYSEPPDLRQSEIRTADLAGFPNSVDWAHREWVDINADGAPGLLNRSSSDVWYYARNRTRGRMASPQPVVAASHLDGSSQRGTRIRLMDLTGDGTLDLVDIDLHSPGYSAKNEDDAWAAKRPFDAFPNLDFNDPNARIFDFDGDGLADFVVTDWDSIGWHPSRGRNGFGALQRVDWSTKDNHAPRLLFNDGNESIYLADMSGDGLTDLVRIRNGEVCYWPNRGRGHFASKVEMQNSPHFAAPEVFDARRLRFADVDGSGTTDLIYLGAKGVRCWRNQSGNAWSDPEPIPFVPVYDPAAFSVVDLLGNGTSCLVWAANDPLTSANPVRYVHLAGRAKESSHSQHQHNDCFSRHPSRVNEKPHLLVRVDNNLGGEIRIFMTSSAEFAAADRDELKPWMTKLGFPVQVVSHIERIDRITDRSSITSYRYHHGYFDGEEREFRGFACVEERDSVSFKEFVEYADSVGTRIVGQEAFHVPPIVKKTWFHTGALFQSESQVRRLQGEYFQGDRDAISLPDSQFEGSLNEDELREAFRALKGKILREETYSEEGPTCGVADVSARPYSVSERSYSVRRLLPKVHGRRAVFFARSDQQLDFHYERQLDDPRVSHAFTLEVDEWGNSTRLANIAYGRRMSGIVKDVCFLTEAEIEIQRRTYVTLSTRDYTVEIKDDVAGRRQAPMLSEARTWQLHGMQPALSNGYFDGSEFDGALTDPLVSEFTHDQEQRAEEASLRGRRSRRLIDQVRVHYVDETGRAPLALGQLTCPALPHRTYKLAFDRLPSMLADKAASVGHDVAALLRKSGYVRLVDTDAEFWWSPQPHQNYLGRNSAEPNRAASFVPIEQLDALGNVTRLEYDLRQLLKTGIQKPLGNATQIVHDYRVLQPKKLVDPNGSVTQLKFDTFGLVVAVAVQGRDYDSGDRLRDHHYELSELELAAFYHDPTSKSRELLGAATTRSIYDPHAYYRSRRSKGTDDVRPVPIWSCVLSRQRHVNQPDGSKSPVEIAWVYTDGFSEDGQSARLASTNGSEMWLRSGKRELNNKGKPVREFEPQFSTDHHFKLARIGVSRTLFYDPLQRVVGILHPDHSWEKTRFGAWRRETWDRNDTSLLNPREDEQLGGFFRGLDDEAFSPSWRQIVVDFASKSNTDHKQALRRTSEMVARHAGTPLRSFLDSLGNVFLVIADNRTTPPGATNPDALDPPTPNHSSLFHTRTEYDIEKNTRRVVDPLGRTIMRWEFDMLGNPCLEEHADWQSRTHFAKPGRQILLSAVDGKPGFVWDETMRFLEYRYDSLRRPVNLTVDGDIAESFRYGESVASPELNYLRGQLVCEFEANTAGAGPVTTSITEYDWNGQAVTQSRTAGGATVTVHTATDARERVFWQQHAGLMTERRHYDLLGQLTQVGVRQAGSQMLHFPVRNVKYNARGQRIQLDHHDRAVLTTRYEYDPLTYRLHRSRTDGAAMNWQHWEYLYDATGNVVHIHDHSSGRDFLKDDHALKAHQDFEYDSTYRLVMATGREHPGQTLVNGQPSRDIDRQVRPQPSDPQQLSGYREHFEYDAVGNLVQRRHVAASSQNSWTKTFEFANHCNHLQRVYLGATPAMIDSLEYDLHGNVTSMAHLRRLDWDYANRLMRACPHLGPEASFAYDAKGNRAVKEEQGVRRIYLGATELADGALTLGIADTAGQRMATVRIQEGRLSLVSVTSDHLGSGSLEVSETANDLRCESFEEYFPYGQSSFGWSRNPKRYRWTGKERDGVTGFYYFGARYFVPWQGNWLSPDPSGIKDGPNRYQYAHSNPTTNVDVDGREAVSFAEAKEIGKSFGVGFLKGAVAVASVTVTVATASAIAPAFGVAVVAGLVAASAVGAYHTLQEIRSGTTADGNAITSSYYAELAGGFAGGALGGAGAAAALRFGGTTALGGAIKAGLSRIGSAASEAMANTASKTANALKASLGRTAAAVSDATGNTVAGARNLTLQESSLSPQAAGSLRQSELHQRLAEEIPENLFKVSGREGKSTPDINTDFLLGDIKRVKYLSLNKQMRIQKEAALSQDKPFVLFIGHTTRLSKPLINAVDIVVRVRSLNP